MFRKHMEMIMTNTKFKITVNQEQNYVAEDYPGFQIHWQYSIP